MFAKIVNLTPQPGHTLLIRFADGASGVVSLAREVAADGVFASLRDPAAFAQARIGPHGRSVEWPGEIDLCADALRLEINSAMKAAS